MSKKQKIIFSVFIPFLNCSLNANVTYTQHTFPVERKNVFYFIFLKTLFTYQLHFQIFEYRSELRTNSRSSPEGTFRVDSLDQSERISLSLNIKIKPDPIISCIFLVILLSLCANFIILCNICLQLHAVRAFTLCIVKKKPKPNSHH